MGSLDIAIAIGGQNKMGGVATPTDGIAMCQNEEEIHKQKAATGTNVHDRIGLACMRRR